MRPLAGATTTSVHGLRLAGPGVERYVVLRRYTWRQFLEEEPHRVQHEIAALDRVAGAGIPSPAVIAVDEHAVHCDAPAVLMTGLPGRPDPRPDDWITAAVRSLTLLHAVDGTGFGWEYRRYAEGTGAKPPPWTARTAMWERALAVAAGPGPATRSGFLHRDFHPGNFLWADGALTGIVDWIGACTGPQGVDVSHLRLNLALAGDFTAVREVRAAYAAAAGAGATDLPHWDVVVAVDILPFYAGRDAVAAWPAGQPWTREGDRARLEIFLATALEEL